jgi:ligand-binding sensor domain-containing protein
MRDMGGDDLVADANGDVWLATGRNLYQYDGFQIVRRTKDDGLLDSYARAVAVGEDGRIWMGQDNGLSIWDGQAFTTLTTADDGWPESNIQTLLFDGDVLWAGTNKGLVRYENGVSELVLHKDVVGLTSPVTYALAKLADGRLLVGTSSGLFYYDHAGRSLVAETAVPVWVTDIAVSREGEIFVTSAADVGGGLYIMDEDGWLHLTTADGLPTNRMRTLLLDSAGTLWAGGGYWGEGGGLMRFVP